MGISSWGCSNPRLSWSPSHSGGALCVGGLGGCIMCIVGSYVSFGRSPYLRAFIEFIEECTGVSLCTFLVYGDLCWHCHWHCHYHCHCHCVSCCEGKSNCCQGFLSNVCALIVVSCEEIMMVCRVVLNPGLLLRRCLSYLDVKIYVELRILISLSHC